MAQYDLPYTGPQVEALLAKISELESEMPSKTSDLTNDSGFITSADVPTKTSDLNNDSGFITNAPVAAEAARAQAAEALLATIASLQAEITRATGVEGTLQDLIDGIAAKIPSTATDQNQLADKAFVNSSIATATATFRGTYDSLAELQAVSADENDYGFFRTTDAAGNTVFKRYKYASGSWVFEYDLNNSSFTASQWAAINSAITAELVEKLRALPTNAALTELLNGKQGVIPDLDTIRSNAAAGGTAYQKPAGGIPKSDMSPEVQSSLGNADSAVQESAIADNLTTNDPKKVLSAKQGKVLSEQVTQLDQKVTDLIVQEPVRQAGFWSNSQNRYVTTGGYSLLLPCKSYSAITIVARPSVLNGYAFVEQFTASTLTFVPGVSGTTDLSPNSSVTINVPSGANYLYIIEEISGQLRKPTYIIGDGQRDLYKSFNEDMTPVKTMPSVLYADGVEYKNGTLSWTSLALLLPGGIVKNISSSSIQFTSGVLVYRPSAESTALITDSTKFIVGDVVLLQIRNGYIVGGLLFPYIKNERPLVIAATNLVFDGAMVSWDGLSILRYDGVVSDIGQSSFTLSAGNPILVYNRNLDSITTRASFANVQNTDVLLLYYRGGKCVAGELLGYYLNYTINNGKYPIVLSATNIAFDNNSLSWDSISIKLPDGTVATVGKKSYNIGVGTPLLVYRPSQGDTRQLYSFSNLMSGDILLAYYKINYGIVEGELTAYLLKNSLRNDVNENGINLNIFRRGKQLRDVKYTARGNFIAGEGTHISGVEYQGVPYSSVKEYLKFVGIDVSLHTFMTTMHDEHSLQYTERPLGTSSESAYGRTYHGVNCNCYFGDVCSAFVTTALGRTVQDNSWEYKSFFERYKVLPNQDPENFLVGDILSMNGHCSIITNLQRRDDGTIETFYVSEQVAASLTSPIVTRAYTMATLKNRMYTSEEKACRYDFLPLHTQYAPSVFVLADGENLYRYGDIVFFDGVSERTFKKCIRENRDSTFDPTKWEDIPEWEANVLYPIGKYVSYGEDVYRAPASIQTAIFDVSMWERITNAFEWTPYPYVYNDDIITFAGDRAAFRTNDLIFINYNKGDYTHLQLYKDGVLIQTLSIPEGYQVDVSSYCASAGMYKARLTDGVNYSRYTYFEVVDTTVSANYANNEATIQFSSVNGKPLEFQIVEESGYPIAHDEFTEQELSNGEIVLNPMALLYVLRHIYWGRYNNDNPKMYARVVFAGEYGNVVNEMIEIGVVNAIEGDLVFPDKTKDFGTISGNKNIILAGRLTNNTYVFSFVVGSSATISIIPAYGEIMWANGTPSFSQGKMYLIQIANGIGTFTELL